jgi:hypothetical protein
MITQPKPVVTMYVCKVCGFTDTKRLREGVNNHWRKGYLMPTRPTSRDAICYAALEEKP